MTFVEGVLDRLSIFRTSVKANPYFVSLILVFFAFVLRLILDVYLNQMTVLLIFIIPVIIAAWYGGFGPGIMASLIGILAGIFIVFEQGVMDTFSIIVRLLVFLLGGVLISLLSEERSRYERERNKMLLSEKHARRSAEEQKKIREHFISVAAHELKSPITSQKVLIQLLRKLEDRKKNPEYQNYLLKIETQTDKLIRFIDDFLDVSKMNSRKLQYHFTFFSLKDCILEGIEQMENFLLDHEVILRGDVRKQVFGDRDRIYQVFTNLLSNAVKYSPQGKKIIITLSQSPHLATISIRDFGIGLEPKDKKKIFNRFFRVSGADESSFKGLGLGLYLSSQIIKRHRGDIWVVSKKGRGSTFYFSLPLAEDTRPR